jgi:DNA (cytosine-5)-methyltransferase 1
MQILSLYSGAGLLDLGFLKNGFTILEACEYNPKFTYCYNEALGIGLKYKFEIHESTDLNDVSVQNLLGRKYNDINGIIGGPPCQDFSVAGKNAGVDGKNGSQVLNYINIVKLTRPKFIFFENVKGLYSTKRHRETLNYLLEQLESFGYIVEYKLINAIEYGVPQFRERVFVIGFRKDCFSDEFIWPKKTHSGYNQVNWPEPWDFGFNEYEPVKLSKKYYDLTVEHAIQNAMIKPNGDEFFMPKSNKFHNVMEGDTSGQSFKRLHRFKYSPTVAYGNNEVHLHPTEARRISVREALRIQSVPDNYIMPEDLDLTAKFKMISNGVPTKLSSAFAKSIKSYLNDNSI